MGGHGASRKRGTRLAPRKAAASLVSTSRETKRVLAAEILSVVAFGGAFNFIAPAVWDNSKEYSFRFITLQVVGAAAVSIVVLTIVLARRVLALNRTLETMEQAGAVSPSLTGGFEVEAEAKGQDEPSDERRSVPGTATARGRSSSDALPRVHESSHPETPWVDERWKARPSRNWLPPPALSMDGQVWAWNTGERVQVKRLEVDEPLMIPGLGVDLIPIAVSPINAGKVRLLTVGGATEDWLVDVQLGGAERMATAQSTGTSGAWIADRFVWTDSNGAVHGPGDLPTSRCTHISSGAGRHEILTAWIDTPRTLTLHRRSNEHSEVRTQPLPEEVKRIDELVVAPTAGAPEHVWVRDGSTWYGWTWRSLAPSRS